MLPKVQQRYALSAENKQVLHDLGIDSKVFETCYGNQIQQKVHQELVSLVDLASMIYEKAQSVDVKELIDCAVDFAATGSVINQHGDIKIAIAAADTSWSLVNCTKALLKVDCDSTLLKLLAIVLANLSMKLLPPTVI